MHQIDSSDVFGDWVLYLQPRVHFKEVEVFLRVDQKLNSSGGAISNLLCQSYRLFAHSLSSFGIQESAKGEKYRFETRVKDEFITRETWVPLLRLSDCVFECCILSRSSRSYCHVCHPTP